MPQTMPMNWLFILSFIFFNISIFFGFLMKFNHSFKPFDLNCYKNLNWLW